MNGKLSIREWAREQADLMDLTPLVLARRAAGVLGCTEESARSKISNEQKRQREAGGTRQREPGGQPSGQPSGIGMSRSEVLSTYDLGTKTRVAARGGVSRLTDDDRIYWDAEFRREMCDNVSTTDWRRVTSEPEFTPYRWRIGSDDVKWSTPATKQWALQNVSRAREV